MISLAHVGVGAALGASTLLGVAVRSGRIELGDRRWLHHALYAASLATATTASLVDAARSRPTWPVAGATLGVLTVLPVTRGGSDAHVAVAVAAMTVYVAGTLVVSRTPRG